MRSTLVKLCVLSALMTPGCGKDSPSDTMVDPTAQTVGTTTTVGSSETGNSVTTEPQPMTTGPQPTTTEAMTSVAETGVDSDTGGTMFLVMPDGGTGGVKECSVWNQDCPAGQKCMPYADNGTTAWNATKCVDVNAEQGQPGDVCTVTGGPVSGIDTCDFGVLCWDVKSDTMKGTCVAQCTGSETSPTCSADTSCFISNDGVLTVCLPKCDPLTQDCANDNLCIPNPQNQAEFTCVLDASGDNGKTFDPCQYVNSCDKGFFCATTASGMECPTTSTGCCLPFCDIMDPPMCPGVGQSCVAWYDMNTAPPGLENVGLCTLP